MGAKVAARAGIASDATVTTNEKKSMPIAIVKHPGGGASSPKKPAKPKVETPFEQVRPLLGPSWIIEGEDPETYERLLAQVADAIGPRDLLDWLLIKDVVALTWEIQRSRRMSASLMRLRQRVAIENILRRLLPKPEYRMPISPEEALSTNYTEGDKKAILQVEALFKKTGLSLADVAVQTLNEHARDFERIDAKAQRCEDRRDKLLQQIERRHAGASRTVLRASEGVIDAEFETTAPID